jgi:hypothetical protein
MSAKERAKLAERLRARDAQVVLAALAEVSEKKVGELIGAVVAQLSEERVKRAPEVVIEALKTLGALGAEAELARAELALPASYGGWVAVARQRLPAR